MAKGKHEAPSKRHSARAYGGPDRAVYASERRAPRALRRKSSLLPLLAALTLIAGMAVGGTVAYLTDSSELMSETYKAAYVDCRIQDEYCVVNTGNIPAYIRVTLVQNYFNSDGAVCIGHEQAPLPAPAEGWVAIGTHYYHNSPVQPGASVQAVSAFEPLVADDHCTLKMQLIAEAIQAEPVNAIEEAWGVTPVTVEELP